MRMDQLCVFSSRNFQNDCIRHGHCIIKPVFILVNIEKCRLAERHTLCQLSKISFQRDITIMCISEDRTSLLSQQDRCNFLHYHFLRTLITLRIRGFRAIRARFPFNARQLLLLDLEIPLRNFLLLPPLKEVNPVHHQPTIYTFIIINLENIVFLKIKQRVLVFFVLVLIWN